jgi:hypothetical protein
MLVMVSAVTAQESPETDLAGIREDLIENRQKLLDAQEQKLNEVAAKLYQKKNFLSNLSELMEHYNVRFNDTILYVDIATQQLHFVKGDEVLKSYPVSTSKYGSGFQTNSFQTPLGAHRIKEKIGAGEKPGIIFEERKSIKKTATIYTDTTDVATDLITSRILWLEGLEDKVNKGTTKDTYERYIYIHGTHEEGLIGKSVSTGCVRMKNTDIISLFDEVREGSLVVIVAKLNN